MEWKFNQYEEDVPEGFLSLRSEEGRWGIILDENEDEAFLYIDNPRDLELPTDKKKLENLFKYLKRLEYNENDSK